MGKASVVSCPPKRLTQPIIHFPTPIFPQVHAAAMSPAMRTHSLVAVGTDDRRVRLCDLKSGGTFCVHIYVYIMCLDPPRLLRTTTTPSNHPTNDPFVN